MTSAITSAVRHAVWRAPCTASSLIQVRRSPFLSAGNLHHQPGPSEPYMEGEHFTVAARESGSTSPDIPLFASPPGAVPFQDEAAGAARRVDVPGVPGAFLVTQLLTPTECAAIIRLSEAMGYTEDAPVSLGRNIRQNENCVWIADDTLTGPIYERCKHMLPQEVNGGAVAGLNARWRLYKYGPGDIFRAHTDGSWPGSGLTKDGVLKHDIYGDRWSQLTFVIYLNGDFDGGETSFHLPSAGPGGERIVDTVPVAATQGAALCFYHGNHPLSHLHEGSVINAGTKYIIRTDVLYMLE
eukprot:CAMPEP_0177783964 /NCGR_PEP_ID=MMETSP0491_2-20121128/19416_1 /TAXON_ID=63592 /ORGANISM="Tetraselmis chuii, Strain PLY429" /LENGTH=296 /DNA_ID=CAMNT_0019304635 /DNA_START=188 /DNA_END=1078 /DNA_ORIENTATION=-